MSSEVRVNKKVWVGLLLLAVILAGGIAYFITDQEDLFPNEDSSAAGANSADVKEDAIEIVTGGGAGDSSTNPSGNADASGIAGRGDGAGDGSAKVPGDGLTDEERAERAIALAETAGDSKKGDGKDANVVARADIMEAITRVKPLVKDCYERMLDDFPDAEGKIVVQLKVKAIEGIGEVEAIKVGDDEKTDLFDTKMHECMGAALSLVTFPLEGEEDAEVVVNYPFNFAKK